MKSGDKKIERGHPPEEVGQGHATTMNLISSFMRLL